MDDAARGPVARPSSPFRERFGYYLLGVGVGCALVGMMWSARKNLRPKPVGQAGASQQVVPAGATLPSQQRGPSAP